MWSTNEIFDGQWPTDEIVYMNYMTGRADPFLEEYSLVRLKQFRFDTDMGKTR